MDKQIDELVARIAADLKGGKEEPAKPQTSVENNIPVAAQTEKRRLTVEDYPLLDKHPDLVNTPTGKNISQMTMDAVRRGDAMPEDLRISREMLLNQAQVAQSAGKPQVAQNFRRAAELTGVPDDEVIRMYDMLRPNRATRRQLEAIAGQLRERYHAPMCADLVLEAMAVYEKRGILLK